MAKIDSLKNKEGEIIYPRTVADAVYNRDGSNLEERITAHLAEIASQEVGKGADIIGLPDPNNLFTATNIGGAMSELFTNVSDGKDLVGGAITGVDDSVVIPTDPTFGDLANAIGNISTGKKWVSGTSGRDINVADLGFAPRIIIFKETTQTNTSYNYGLYLDRTVLGTVSGVNMQFGSSISYNPFTVTRNGFSVYAASSGIYAWIAFE